MAKKPGVPYSNAQTHSEALLEAYLDSPEVREKRAKAALEAAIARDNPQPAAPTLTPAEQQLRDFYNDPQRREEKARRALEDAIRREVDAKTPAAGKTPAEQALADFYNDPERREKKARKALEEARQREADEGAAKPGLGAKAVGAAKSGIQDVLGMVAGKFLAVAGPLAIVSTLLNSASSGFQVVTKSVQLLAAVIAPILLPATVLLSTALVALSSILETGLESSLEPFFDIVLGLGVPALIALVMAADYLAGVFKTFQPKEEPKPASGGRGGGEGGEGEEEEGFFAQVGSGLKQLATAAVLPSVEILKYIKNEVNSEIESNRDGSAAKARDTIFDSLEDVLTSLRQSIGPKAQISGLSGISNAVQLAALNQDPIEARMLQVQQNISRLLERAIGRLRNDGVYSGDGDFSGDRGAGGSYEDVAGAAALPSYSRPRAGNWSSGSGASAGGDF